MEKQGSEEWEGKRGRQKVNFFKQILLKQINDQNRISDLVISRQKCFFFLKSRHLFPSGVSYILLLPFLKMIDPKKKKQ